MNDTILYEWFSIDFKLPRGKKTWKSDIISQWETMAIE